MCDRSVEKQINLQIVVPNVCTDRNSQANEVLFVDSEHEDEVLTFREVFLGSRALELLLAGFIAQPPSGDEEHGLLAALLGATLGGDAALHQVGLLAVYWVFRVLGFQGS